MREIEKKLGKIHKKKLGRPSSFKPEYVDQVYKLALMGYTDEDFANFFEVDVNTIDRWKIKYEAFRGALKEGREIADTRVTESLYRRAIGYTRTVQEAKVISTGNYESKVEIVTLVQEVEPNVTAQIFWLKNRQKSKWREKHEIGLTNSKGEDAIPAFNIVLAAQCAALPDINEDETAQGD